MLINGISVLRQRERRDPLATVSEDMVEQTLTKHKDASARLAPPPWSRTFPTFRNMRSR